MPDSSKPTAPAYATPLRLEPDRIVETVATLQRRIEERFPDSGLGRVCGRLLDIAERTKERLDWVERPNLYLRVATWAMAALVIAGVLAAFTALTREGLANGVQNPLDLVQALESALQEIVFVGIGLVFLLTMEGRVKRTRALRFIRELRALGHIVDMHQLTKDPHRLAGDVPSTVPSSNTASSPARTLTRDQLGRYLDYCSELLSLTSKVAALYAERLDDSVVLTAVDQVEDMTTGLASKIWQKIMILDAPEEGARSGFTLIEAMVAITLTSVIVVLVSTVFLVQNNFFSRQIEKSAAQDNARMVTELVAEGVRSVMTSGVVVATSSDLVVRSPMTLAVVCAQPSSSGVTVHVDGGLADLDTTEVGGFGVRDANNGDWKYYDVGWATIHDPAGTPAAECAANSADTVGATADFVRLKSITSYASSLPAVGSILMLYRNLEFAFAKSGMDSTTYGLYRGLYGGTLVEFATGMDSTAAFQYRTGGSTYDNAVSGGKELKKIDAIRIVALARKRAWTGGQDDITYGWSVNLVLRNGS